MTLGLHLLEHPQKNAKDGTHKYAPMDMAGKHCYVQSNRVACPNNSPPAATGLLSLGALFRSTDQQLMRERAKSGNANGPRAMCLSLRVLFSNTWRDPRPTSFF